jgi:hypothetical protein
MESTFKTFGQMDREADKWINIRKLILSLCDYANSPKNVVGIETKTMEPSIILLHLMPQS